MKGLPLTALTIAANVHATPIPVCRNSKLCIKLTFVTITFNYCVRSLVKTVMLIIEMGYVNDIPAVSILGPEILSQGRKLLLADYA